MINSVTEQESFYSDLEKKSFRELLEGINNEDKKVPFAVEKVIPVIEELVTKAFPPYAEGRKAVLHRCRHQRTSRGAGCIGDTTYIRDGTGYGDWNYRRR